MLETFAGIVHADRTQSRRQDTAAGIYEQKGSDESTTVDRDDEFHLLPPDERVLTLLQQNGGRMWQQEVITETGYSPGQVSKLLSEMEDDGQVKRYWKHGQKIVVRTHT